MNAKLSFVCAALFLALVANIFPQGSLIPPGAPTPTMKSLDQIEARTPISSAPFTISQPGSYYLTANLTVSAGNAITVAASGVSLDLNGFTISSTTPSAAGYGIVLNNGVRDITIANGHIRGGVTNSGGTYSGPGFNTGIYAPSAGNVLVSRVSVSGCLGDGIYVLGASPSVVESCTVWTVGSAGIDVNMVRQSSAVDCGYTGISGEQVSDCHGEGRIGAGISAVLGNALNCYGSSDDGYGLIASTAQNCIGRTLSSTNPGISADTALNCYGYSGYTIGISATTALNCRAYSNQGTAINATTAQNCYGESGGTDAFLVSIGYNCRGRNTGNGSGFYAYENAYYCFGQSDGSGYGLWATRIAIGCSGLSGTGVGLRWGAAAAMCEGRRTSPAATAMVLGAGLAGTVNLP